MPHRSPVLTTTADGQDARRQAGLYAEFLGITRVEKGAAFVPLGSAGIELVVVPLRQALAG